MSDGPSFDLRQRFPLLAVLPSRIHGHGLFAVEPLPAGELLMHLGGEEVEVSDAKSIEAVPYEWNALAPDRLLVRKEPTLYQFINHSPTPNAVVSQNGRSVYVQRAIEAHEEITLDYGAQPLPPAYRANPVKAAFLSEQVVHADRRWVSITLLHSIRVEPKIARALMRNLNPDELPMRPLSTLFKENGEPLVAGDGTLPVAMIVRALREARNLSTYVLDETAREEVIQETPSICRDTAFILRHRRGMGIMSDEGQFLYVTEIDFLDVGDPVDFASRAARLLALVCAKRNPVENLDLGVWYEEGKRRVHAAVMNVLRAACPGALPRVEHVTFPYDTAYPMIIVHGPGPHRYDWLFAAEESAAQVTHVGSVDDTVEGAFVHLGWCYGIAAGVRQPVAARGLLAVVAHMQMDYHLRWLINRMLQMEMSESASVRTSGDLEERSAAFDELLRDYERSRVRAAAFFGTLRPRIYEAAERLRQCWHQDESFAALDQAFRTQRGFLERRHQCESERAALRQQKALNFIVVVQTFSVLSVAVDGANLRKDFPGLFGAILFLSFGLAIWVWGKTKSYGE